MNLPRSRHEGQVSSASYNPAGDRIVTGSLDGTAKVWPVDVEELLELADPLIQRYNPWLTPAERERYGVE
jgi:WD40 repeat protein